MQELTLEEVMQVSGGNAASLSTNLALGSAVVAAAAAATYVIPQVSATLWIVSAGFAGLSAVANAYSSVTPGGGRSQQKAHLISQR